jgi:hypothetical protein
LRDTLQQILGLLWIVPESGLLRDLFLFLYPGQFTIDVKDTSLTHHVVRQDLLSVHL